MAYIPAEVRYDKDLPPGARLLYGELTALASTDRGCFAHNKYFADLYGVSVRVIQQWISLLEDKGYIERTSGRWTDNGERQIKIRSEVRQKQHELLSYDEIFEQSGVRGVYKDVFIEFIKHCNLNGRILTNDKLWRIVWQLDDCYRANEQAKIDSLKDAIDNGWYDIKENHTVERFKSV